MLARGLPEPKENPAAVYAFRGGSVSFCFSIGASYCPAQAINPKASILRQM